MNQEKAIEIVNKLLLGLQRARSTSREGTEALARSGTRPEIIDGVLEDLTPWLHGPKAEALLNSLAQVYDRDRVTGGELYNFMTIIHVLNPTIAAMAGILTDYTFPKPSLEWFKDLGIDSQL